MSQRVSLFDLWDELQRDPSYRDRDLVQEIVNNIWAENRDASPTFKLNSNLVAIGLATDPVFRLICVLCGLCGLRTYKPGERRPTGWSGQKFADLCHLDLEIHLDELEKVLIEHKLELPKAWFLEGEKSPTSDELIAKELTSKSENAFHRGVGVWLLKFEGQHAYIKDLDGLAYIAHLLKRSHEKILSSDLIALAKKRTFESEPNAEEMNLSSLDLDLTPEELDRLENAGYEIIEDLDNAKDSNDKDWLERAENKMEQYRELMLNEYGVKALHSDKYGLYFKKLHRRSPEQENARQTVNYRITYAYNKIGKDISALEDYLRQHIRFKIGLGVTNLTPRIPLTGIYLCSS